MTALRISLALALLVPRAAAFGPLQPFVDQAGSILVSSSFVSTPASILLSDEGIPDAAIQATQAVVETAKVVEETGLGGEVGEILKNIAFAITAVLFLGAGLTLLTASVIIPAAAKELEQECKELAPELWDQYSALLKDGETMASRPDLMQELGGKLQPLVDAKVERQFATQREQGIDVSKDYEAYKALDRLNDKIPKPASAASSAQPTIDIGGQWDDDDDVVDAEIVKKDAETEK